MLLERSKSLICPRCEKPMDDHVAGECPGRKLSRRFFLGFLGSAVAATVLSNVVVDNAAAADQLVVTAAPLVHQSASFELEGSLDSLCGAGYGRHGTMEQLRRELSDLANQKQRPVIAKVRVRGEKERVIVYAEPDIAKKMPEKKRIIT